MGWSMTDKSNGYQFHVSKDAAARAMETLAAYVAERAQLLDPEAKVKMPAVHAVHLMDTLYRFKEDLQNLVKTPVEKAYDFLRFTVIPNLMDAEGTTSLTVAGVGRVNLQDDVQVKTLDPDQLRTWLTDNDLEDMIKPTVNAQTLAAWVRQRVREEKDVPACLEVRPIVRATITRAGVK